MMKNSKLRRILLLLACAVLLVSLSVGATLAYLTSTADVTNTFTVGNVEIKLDEATVDAETGKAKEGVARTETGNTDVRMVPGRLIDKDPTVTVLANSEDCYVRVKVTVDVSENWKKPEEGKEDTFEAWAGYFENAYIRTGDVAGFNKTNWNVISPTVENGSINTDARTVTYILTYKSSDSTNIVANQTSDTQLPAIFDNVYVPENLDKDNLAKLAGMKIKVVAEAIQAEGFTSDDTKTAEMKAWEAFEAN